MTVTIGRRELLATLGGAAAARAAGGEDAAERADAADRAWTCNSHVTIE
jgi:hypothetical protein